MSAARERRRVDRGTAAGGWVEAAAARQGRMCLIASVCFCAAENCWAKFSTASPKRPVWDTGAFRNRALSASFMSARHSQRWHSWTTMVDIARPNSRWRSAGGRKSPLSFWRGIPHCYCETSPATARSSAPPGDHQGEP